MNWKTFGSTGSLFIWIGFVSAISFMEAWIKFQAPGVSLPIGLGIGRLVFSALNKVEWVLCILFLLSAYAFLRSHYRGRSSYVVIVAILLIQTCYLLPKLDERALLQMQEKIVDPSYLHLVFIGAECIKVALLSRVAFLYLRYREGNLKESYARNQSY